MAKMKVFAGTLMVRRLGQMSAVVAATSKKRAAELTGESLYSFRHYWTETGNRNQIDSALAEPETVLVAPLNSTERNYRKLEEVEVKA